MSGEPEAPVFDARDSFESEVTYSEEPLFHPADDIIRWKRYLGARTKEVLGRGPGADPPNPRFGRWRPLA